MKHTVPTRERTLVVRHRKRLPDGQPFRIDFLDEGVQIVPRITLTPDLADSPYHAQRLALLLLDLAGAITTGEHGRRLDLLIEEYGAGAR